MLKTELCSLKQGKSSQCPVCSKWIYLLSENHRPFAKNHSKIRCSDSNELLGGKNEAVILPNHKIYGIDCVRKNMEKNNGYFVPMNQNKTYEEKDLMKVYFL